MKNKAKESGKKRAPPYDAPESGKSAAGTKTPQAWDVRVVFLGGSDMETSELIRRMTRADSEPGGSWNTPCPPDRDKNKTSEIPPVSLRCVNFHFTSSDNGPALCKCFLTRRTVYVIICNENSDCDEQAKPWLDLLNRHKNSHGCPVILFLNLHEKNKKAPVNEKYLLALNSNLILPPINDENALRKAVMKQASDIVRDFSSFLPHANTDARPVLDILNEPAKSGGPRQPLISPQEFQKVCETEDQNKIARIREYLCCIGALYDYTWKAAEYPERKYTRLRSFLLIDPLWLLEHMRRLISKTVDKALSDANAVAGLMEQDGIRRTLRDGAGDLTVAAEEFIYQTMLAHEILYEIEIRGESAKLEILPDGLPSKAPQDGEASECYENYSSKDALHLRFEGKSGIFEIPSNLLWRLMGRMKTGTLHRGCVWQHGLAFQNAHPSKDADGQSEENQYNILIETGSNFFDVFITGAAEKRHDYYESDIRGMIGNLLNPSNISGRNSSSIPDGVDESIIYAYADAKGDIQECPVSYRAAIIAQSQDREVYIDALKQYIPANRILQKPDKPSSRDQKPDKASKIQRIKNFLESHPGALKFITGLLLLTGVWSCTALLNILSNMNIEIPFLNALLEYLRDWLKQARDNGSGE